MRVFGVFGTIRIQSYPSKVYEIILSIHFSCDIIKIANKLNLNNISIDGNTYNLTDNMFNQNENNLLTALNAYTQLTHFDELLRDSFGLEIDI